MFGDDLGLGLRSIGEAELDVGGAGDDVQAGEDIAHLRDDDAGAKTVADLTVGTGGLGLDQDQRGADRLIHAGRESGRRRGRGQGLCDGLIYLLRGKRAWGRHQPGVEQDRQECRQHSGCEWS